MKTLIKNADIITKDQVLYGGFCLIEDGIILKWEVMWRRRGM